MASDGRPRYAIYFTPPRESALWQFGTRVIGYDPYDAHMVVSPRHGRLATVLQDEHRVEPRRYGFHATLRAPFELSPATSADGILASARAFAAGRRPVQIGDLRVTQLAGFIALVCAAAPPALADLAEACLRHFEPLRAPLSTADRDRRLAAPLTARQLRHLDDWGYPYVLEDFTFHMTLTGKLDDRTMALALPVLEQLHAEIAAPVALDAITVLEQTARSGPFCVIGRFALATEGPT